MKTADLDYDLPAELIATRPVRPRHDARLMVVRCDEGSIDHHTVRDLPELLAPGDLLVSNDTAVLAARLVGHRPLEGSRGGGRVDGLFLEAHADGTWIVLLQTRGRLEPGMNVLLGHPHDVTCTLELLDRAGRGWRVRPTPRASLGAAVAGQLEQIGLTPLPPYILRARRNRNEQIDDALDRDWYATDFAREDRRGSVAAPTAGMHLSSQVQADLADRGVHSCCVTLHVGAGTFRPVEAEDLADHEMHAESWLLDAQAAQALSRGPDAGRRVVAVGTTTARLLESLPEEIDPEGCAGETRLLIEPGHHWHRVEAMMTNFHLPRSTLLALVAALAGLELVHRAYREAVDHRYRFYSYGDAMLILP